MGIEINLGRNGTGKTLYLTESYEKDKVNSIFFSTDYHIKEFVKKAKIGSGANTFESPQEKLINMINKKILESFTFSPTKKQTKELEAKITKTHEILKSIKNRIKEDKYFEESLLKSFSISDKKSITLESNKILWSFDKEFEKLKPSSGVEFYSFLITIIEMITSFYDLIKDKEELSNINLIIDEPERFSHPELIIKIGHTLVHLSKYINIRISTHSPLLVQTLFENDDNFKYNFFNGLKNGENTWSINNLDLIQLNLKNVLKDQNSRRTQIIIKSLFSTNIIFYEGLNDEIFLKSLIKEEVKTKKNISYFDAGDRGGVEKCSEILKKLNLISICLFYDLDWQDKNKGIYKNKIFVSNDFKYIKNIPNLESSFFKEGKNKHFFKKCGTETHKDKLDFNINKLKMDWSNKDAENHYIEILENIKEWLGEKNE